MLKKLSENKTIFNTVISLTIKFLAAILSFVLSVLLARILGAGDLGIYYLAITVVTLCTVFARMGLDNALLKFISYNYSIKNWVSIIGLNREMIKLIAFSAITISMILFLLADIIAIRVFKEEDLAFSLRVLSLIILPLSIINLYAEMLKGINKIKIGTFIQSITLPFLNIIMIVLSFFLIKLQLSHILFYYVIAAYLILIYSLFLWKNNIPKEFKNTRGYFSREELLNVSIPLMWVASLNLVLSYMDTLMIGWFMDTREVALYSVAARVVLMSSMILVAINGVISQKFSVYWELEKREEIEKLTQVSTMLLFLISLFIFLFFITLAKPILSIFGNDFIEASNIFIILAFGQFVVLGTGPVAALLMMSGNGIFHKKNMLFSAMLNLMLNIILIPAMGATGAATATAISLIIKNLIAVMYVRKKLDINIFSNWKKIIVESWYKYVRKGTV